VVEGVGRYQAEGALGRQSQGRRQRGRHGPAGNYAYAYAYA